MKTKLPLRGKVKVVFQNSEGPGGKEPIFASLNGKPIRIPRGHEVEIDVRYLHGSIHDAVNIEYAKPGDDTTATRVPRYPYTLIEVVEDLDAKASADTEGKAEGKTSKSKSDKADAASADTEGK